MQTRLCCSKCNSPPISSQYTTLFYSLGIYVPIKGLNNPTVTVPAMICRRCRRDCRSAVVADVKNRSCGCWYIRARPVVSSAKLVPSWEICARTSAWRWKCLQHAARCQLTALSEWPGHRRKSSNASFPLWKCYELWVARCACLLMLICLTQSRPMARLVPDFSSGKSGILAFVWKTGQVWLRLIFWPDLWIPL